MNLILSNGYPYPCAGDLSEAQRVEHSMAAPACRLVIRDVVHFEQKHTTTVEFVNSDARGVAMAITGWPLVADKVLAVSTIVAEGYDHPAIIVGSIAYCCHMLADERIVPAPLKTDPLDLLRSAVRSRADNLDLQSLLELELEPMPDPTPRRSTNPALTALIERLAIATMSNEDGSLITAVHLAEAIKLCAVPYYD